MSNIDSQSQHRLPAFGRSPERVRDVTVDGYSTYARLFAPFDVLDGLGVRRMSWSAACSSQGRKLTPYTTWEDLYENRTSSIQSEDWERPRGTLDLESVQALIAGVGDEDEPAAYVLWNGYAGEVDALVWPLPVPLPSTHQSYIFDGSYSLVTAPLSWAETRADEHLVHFPVACWTLSGTVVLASGLYQDSWYLSCTPIILTRLLGLGLDLMELNRDVPLPSGGD